MVLEETWKEPLGAISPESLKAEGFESLAQFRRYWMKRTRRQFRPAALITCYRVRPWEPDDERRFGASIMERLYGAFLPATEAA